MADEKKSIKVQDIQAGKSMAMDSHSRKQLREGEKPSAPANLVLPEPVKVPVAAGPVAPNKSEKK